MIRTNEIAEAWSRSPVSRVPPDEVILVTDFDGTLAEIVADPMQAAALPKALAALGRLVPLLADVVVLSSRAPEQLQRLVPVPDVRLIGDSGLALPRKAQKEALDRFNADVAKLLERVPGAWLEIKPASSAVHFRNANMSGEEMLAYIRPLLEGGRLAAALGRKVIEVHAPGGKGTALAALLPSEDPKGIVCFGDDENDRPMFEYVSNLETAHMCVGVNSPEAPARLFDRCDLVVSGPEEAAALMAEIVEWATARTVH